MQVKSLVPVVLGVVLLSLTVTSVFADPLFSGNAVAVGNQYSINTVNGSAEAWIDGRLVTGPANLQLQVQVSYVGPYNVHFQILSGTFLVANKNYVVTVSQWYGNYNLQTHTSVYQGPATAPNGGIGYFTLYGQDIGLGNGGVVTHINSNFVGEYGALWHVSLTAVRYQTV